ncbi:MAG: SOS response-associated peptidase [Sandaracinaceae bacterium]|nr:SOS response-associated peptidase [Sandaracinaceae bacterium]
MCGRYTLSETPEWSELDIHVPDELLVTPRYNAAPGRPQLVVTREADGPLTLGERRWGTQLGPRRVINARRESLGWATWREHLARCVVPADGYVEWQTTDAGKRPLWLRSMDPAQRLLWMAGLVLPDGFVVVTTPASGDVRAIHPRMPALLPPERLRAWLDAPFAQARALLETAPDGLLQALPLGPRINSPAHDDPACLEPEAHARQLDLFH